MDKETIIYLDGFADGLNMANNSTNKMLDKIKAKIKSYTDPKGFIVIGENRFNMILDRCKAESEDGNDD